MTGDQISKPTFSSLITVVQLVGHDIALRRDNAVAEAAAGGGVNALGNARVALHQRVQILRVEDEEAGARDRRDRRRAPGAAQHRNLAEEMPGLQAHALVLELDLDLEDQRVIAVTVAERRARRSTAT